MTGRNRQWVLAAHPEGMPEEANWKLVERDIKEPGPGEILVKALWLSVDPYMRGRISKAKNYAQGVQVGEVMTGGYPSSSSAGSAALSSASVAGMV